MSLTAVAAHKAGVSNPEPRSAPIAAHATKWCRISTVTGSGANGVGGGGDGDGGGYVGSSCADVGSAPRPISTKANTRRSGILFSGRKKSATLLAGDFYCTPLGGLFCRQRAAALLVVASFR